MADDRRLDVLRAIIEDFVSTREPVGSRALVERHQLGVSPATIRNDMAALEEEGLIAQPHTSAGRIPTDKGYRLFVDRLAQLRPISPAERRAIHAFLDQAVDLDDVMVRTVRLLAQMTHQVAMVQYPLLTQSRVRHAELVALGGSRLLLVIIADTGRVEQRVIDIPVELTDNDISELRAGLNTALTGQRFVDVPERVSGLADRFEPEIQPAVASVLATLLATVIERHEERIVVAGTANLARVGSDFPRTLEPVLDALEEQMVLLRLLGEQVSEHDAITVTIGSENEVEGLTTASVVTSGYGRQARPMAGLGIVGPTRMDYPAAMGAVRAVARYLGRILSAG